MVLLLQAAVTVSHTICNFTVLPSSSIVRIFYDDISSCPTTSQPRGNTYEVHADRRDVALRVRIVRKPQEQARLSDAGVSDQEQLEKIIVSWEVSC
jgi:hypothetical protein